MEAPAAQAAAHTAKANALKANTADFMTSLKTEMKTAGVSTELQDKLEVKAFTVVKEGEAVKIYIQADKSEEDSDNTVFIAVIVALSVVVMVASSGCMCSSLSTARPRTQQT